MKPACHLHDRVNLVLLPILGSLFVLGLLDYIDTKPVTVAFTAYVLLDLAWVSAIPDAVPSLPSVIQLHHVVALVLLAHPLLYPHLGKYTCWDGLCELNTFFLIARRQWKSQRTLFSAIYWATFFPMRIFLYPYMLVYFYRELAQPQYSRLSLVLCCGAQVVLILFNVVLLWLSVSNWWQRPARGERRPAAPGAVTATLSVGDGQSRAPKNAPTARKRISRAINSARDSMRVLR